MQEGMHLEYENFKEALSAPKKEPRQFQNRRGDWQGGNDRGGGGFTRGGKRGGRGGYQNSGTESNDFGRREAPAAQNNGD